MASNPFRVASRVTADRQTASRLWCERCIAWLVVWLLGCALVAAVLIGVQTAASALLFHGDRVPQTWYTVNLVLICVLPVVFAVAWPRVRSRMVPAGIVAADMADVPGNGARLVASCDLRDADDDWSPAYVDYIVFPEGSEARFHLGAFRGDQAHHSLGVVEVEVHGDEVRVSGVAWGAKLNIEYVPRFLHPGLRDGDVSFDYCDRSVYLPKYVR